jgi:hypothetical protein
MFFDIVRLLSWNMWMRVPTLHCYAWNRLYALRLLPGLHRRYAAQSRSTAANHVTPSLVAFKTSLSFVVSPKRSKNKFSSTNVARKGRNPTTSFLFRISVTDSEHDAVACLCFFFGFHRASSRI